MDRDFLIQLTNNLYRLTLLFPKKEPLRYKIRELGDSILIKPSDKDIEALDAYFEVAKAQNWVSPSDMLAIQGEYANLRGALKTAKPEKKEDCPVAETASERTGRQEKILNFLKENGRAQVWQMKQVLPEITKRTLRRDFEYMLEQGVIERMGENNNTFYQVKRSEA